MFERLNAAIAELRTALEGIDQSRLTGVFAIELANLCCQADRTLTATRLLATRRVDETKAWQKTGHRSAADWMAATTGTNVGHAVGLVETARRLED